MSIKQMSFGAYNNYLQDMSLQILYICAYKQDLALSNLQELMCHKTQPINWYYF